MLSVIKYTLICFVVHFTVNAMQEVTNLKEIEQFAGQVVAYNGPAHLARGYSDENGTRYAYIHSKATAWYGEPEHYYCKTLLKNEQDESWLAIYSESLQNKSYKMRLLTKAEKKWLLGALKRREVKFSKSPAPDLFGPDAIDMIILGLVDLDD